MTETPSPTDQEIIKLLDALKTFKAEYPPELLAKRRTAFMAQLALPEKFSVKNFNSIEHSLEDEHIIGILGELKPIRAEYPSMLMAKQRAAFLDQAERRRRDSWLVTLRSAIQSGFSFTSEIPAEMTNAFQKSLILVGVLAAVFAGLVFGKFDRYTEPARPHATQGGIAQHVPINPTATYETTETSCTPDSTSSLCSSYGFDKDPGQESWVSKSADSWIKIDTGETKTIHMVELDKEYFSNSIGDFTISVAVTDSQYKQVYDSRSDNSTGKVSGPETVQVSFEPELARYVLITVTAPGMVINEVRTFSSIQPPTPTPDQITGNTKEPPLPPLGLSDTPLPPPTPLPTDTPLPPPTPLPTDTPLPSPTSLPTDTPLPPPTSLPTDTPLPPPTSLPTDTPPPAPTSLPPDTPLPPPTSLPPDTPLPANTPLPPDTPLPANTPLPSPPDVPTETSSES